MPPQRLYFCLAVNAKRIGFLQNFFFGACWRVGVVVEGSFVCHHAVDKRGRSPLNWIGQMRDDKGLFMSNVDHYVINERDAIAHVYRR
jgi:hypothetical protein